MTLMLWLAFLLVIGTLVVIDLGLVTRRPRVVTPLEALASFLLWVMSAVGFSLLVWYVYEENWLNIERALGEAIGPPPKDMDGRAAWVQWLTAYVIELALSLDNIAIATLLVRYFKVPREMVGRALFWNTLFSLVGRWLMVLAGAWLLRSVEWMKWAFCGVLVLAMLRTLLAPDERTDFDRKLAVRAMRWAFPVSPTPVGNQLFTRIDNRLHITPVMLVVLVSLIADLTFAVDSVPALFSVTRDPFLAFSASAFALLGLRSLYFTLAGVLGRFRYLRVSLVFVLLCVAGKMFLVSRNPAYFDNHPTLVMLSIVSGVMALGVGASALRQRLAAPAAPAAAAAPTTDELRPTPLEDLSEAVDVTRRNFRKVVILLVGSAVVLFGIAIAPLPGPGPVVIVPLGLAILATEFIWARRLLNSLKAQTQAMAAKADQVAAKTSPVLAVCVMAGALAGVIGLAHFGPYSTRLVYMIGAGPLLAIGYWTWRTIRAWRRHGRARGSAPATTDSNAAGRQDAADPRRTSAS